MATSATDGQLVAALHPIISDLSGHVALRLEKAFGVRMDTLIRLQSAWDIAQTRKRERSIRFVATRRRRSRNAT